MIYYLTINGDDYQTVNQSYEVITADQLAKINLARLIASATTKDTVVLINKADSRQFLYTTVKHSQLLILSKFGEK